MQCSVKRPVICSTFQQKQVGSCRAGSVKTTVLRRRWYCLRRWGGLLQLTCETTLSHKGASYFIGLITQLYSQKPAADSAPRVDPLWKPCVSYKTPKNPWPSRFLLYHQNFWVKNFLDLEGRLFDKIEPTATFTSFQHNKRINPGNKWLNRKSYKRPCAWRCPSAFEFDSAWRQLPNTMGPRCLRGFLPQWLWNNWTKMRGYWDAVRAQLPRWHYACLASDRWWFWLPKAK